MSGIQESLTSEFVQTVTVPIGTKPRKLKATHRCNFCGEDKPRNAFRVYGYHHGLRLDSRCIECYPAYQKSIQGKYPRKKRDPEKQRVRDMVRAAIKKGIITKLPCEVCGEKGQPHHNDYGKPFDLQWLCIRHHAEKHRKYNY